MGCCLRRSTLVCDGVPEAKRLAFMGPERHKVVALDGTLIGKQGFITGGMSGNEAARASRWNDSALEGLKKVGSWVARNMHRLLTMPLCLDRNRVWQHGTVPQTSSILCTQVSTCHTEGLLT